MWRIAGFDCRTDSLLTERKSKKRLQSMNWHCKQDGNAECSSLHHEKTGAVSQV